MPDRNMKSNEHLASGVNSQQLLKTLWNTAALVTKTLAHNSHKKLTNNVIKDTEPAVYTSEKVLLQQSTTSFAQTTLRHTYKPLTHCDENSYVNLRYHPG